MALPKLKDITWVTTDCYGTLIDWEKGILEGFRREATRDGFSFDEESFLNRFFEIEAEIIRGSYELYAEVLRRAAVGDRLGARALAGPVPARQRWALASVSRVERCHGPPRQAL